MNKISTKDWMYAFSWESQAKQYPLTGDGIEYYRGILNETKWVECLLFYGEDKRLHGILNYYPFDFPPFQKKGSVNIQVRTDKRRNGIATSLLKHALTIFQIDLQKQDFTASGKMFIMNFLRTEKETP